MKQLLSSKLYLTMYSHACKCLFVLVLFLFSVPCQAQLEHLEINPTLTSGIIQSIDSTNQIGFIQLKIVDLDLEKVNFIRSEFNKYSGDILGYGYSVLDSKIIVCYQLPVYPNYLLAILDRSNIKGFYEHQGSLIYYVKDGYSSFIR